MAHGDSFGGRAGDVVARAVSPAALVTGLVAGFSVATVVWICFKTGIEQLAPGLASVVFAGFIARAAVDRRDARWRGARGVPFADFAPVALQYLLLNVILLLPMLLVGWRPDLMRALVSLREESGPALTLLLFYVLVIFIAPPLLLIVAVSARETTQIISPAHWSRCFADRGTDVFLIYVLYVGSLFASVALCLPLVVLFATFTAKTLLFTLPLTVIFAAGAAVLLLGGLCGEYARVAVDAPIVERQAPSPVVVLPPPTSRKPPLLDAGKRVAETSHDIAALETLRDAHAPNPAVLHALSFAYVREGRRDDAIAVAREGIPLAMRSGGVILAAEMFDQFRADADFGMQREQVVALADALRNSKRLAMSARLYVFAVESQPNDVRAIKGTMATAEEFVAAGDDHAALQLYDFLLERCAASPLMDFVRERRAGSLTRL